MHETEENSELVFCIVYRILNKCLKNLEETEEDEELAEIPLNNFERKQSIKGHGEEVDHEDEAGETQINVHHIS